jgi:hypothetical protein
MFGDTGRVSCMNLFIYVQIYIYIESRYMHTVFIDTWHAYRSPCWRDFCLVRYAMWSPVMGAICERSRWDSENVQERNFVETGSILLTSSTHTHIYIYVYMWFGTKLKSHCFQRWACLGLDFWSSITGCLQSDGSTGRKLEGNYASSSGYIPWIPMITRVVMIEPTLTGVPYRRSKNIWIHANQQG